MNFNPYDSYFYHGHNKKIIIFMLLILQISIQLAWYMIVIMQIL